MHGILCGYLLYSMKNILTMAAPASHGTCVHDTEHLLKETHSPTHTVNFCKYYKGKNLFLTVSRLRANFLEKAFWKDLLLLVTFSMKRENTVGWLNLTCVDNSLTLGNYAQRTHDFSCPNTPVSKIQLISHTRILKYAFKLTSAMIYITVQMFTLY